MTQAGNSLIAEMNKTKFFHKYRAVSQELEKCLDDLLLISDTISSLEDDEEGESAELEEDDKPPDDLSPTTPHEGMGQPIRAKYENSSFLPFMKKIIIIGNLENVLQIFQNFIVVLPNVFRQMVANKHSFVIKKFRPLIL